MNKKGISLIVLVITIIIILILAGAVILSLSNNNPIENANKAIIMQDMDTFKSELSLSIANKVSNQELHSTSEVNAAGDDIFEYIPSMQGRKVNGLNYSDILVISNGKLAVNSEANIPEVTSVVISQALNGVAAAVTPSSPTLNTAGSIIYETKNVGKLIADNNFTNELTKVGDGIVTYSSSNTSVATVDETTGEVTIVGAGETTITATVLESDTYEYETKIATYNLGVYSGAGALPVAYAKAVINSSNIASYIGTEVDYSTSGDSSGIYRIFYLDVEGKYDDRGTLFIKRDYESNTAYRVDLSAVASTKYSIDDFKQFNTEYPSTATSLSSKGDTHAAYLCTKSNWTTYLNMDLAEYAIGSPSLELFIDSYNQWKETKTLDCKYATTGWETTTSMRYISHNGYEVAPGEGKTDITDFGDGLAENLVEAGPTEKAIYTYGSSSNYWLASPSCESTSYVFCVFGSKAFVKRNI